MPRGSLTCRNTLAFKLLAWSLVVSILLSSLPIPVAVVSESSSDANVPYPCRNGKCGCKSALQCWTSCCCHTPQQRLDWAAANGVKVPEYGQHLHQVVAAQKATVTSPKAACCEKVVSNSATKAACCSSNAKSNVATAKPRTNVVLSMLALGCRGSLGELANLPWAIVRLPEFNCGYLMPLESAIPLVDVQGPTQFYPPELPPPKSV